MTITKTFLSVLITLILLSGQGLAQTSDDATAVTQEVIKIWPGQAPGSENWEVAETLTTSPNGDRVYANVSEPTIEVFLPAAGAGNGTAIVIAPGGAMRVLGYDGGGTEIARWLNTLGVAGFVLKYRTVQQTPIDENTPRITPSGFGGVGSRVELQVSDMPLANAIPERNNQELQEVVQMGIADVQQALRLIRKNADKWEVNVNKVGAMGFSAGGGVIIGSALTDDHSEGSPDFLVSLYGPALIDVHVPEHAPPLFMAVGSEHFNVTNGLLALFSVWKAAGKPVELHVYDGVNGGFDLAERGLPVDGWNEQLEEWLVARDIIPE